MAIKTNSGFYVGVDEPNHWNAFEAEALRLRLAMSQAFFGEWVLSRGETWVRRTERLGRGFTGYSKLQRESLDAFMRAAAKVEQLGPLDKRWGVRPVEPG